MLSRRPTPLAPLRAYAIAILLAVTPAVGAKAEPTPESARAWERFVEICPAAVADEDPVAAAEAIVGERGNSVGSDDGHLHGVALTFRDLMPSGDMAGLQVTVNNYRGGRTVQCTLQMVGDTEAMIDLVDIVRNGAATVLGDQTALVSHGGPLTGMTSTGFPAPQNNAEMVRVVSEGFPPRAMLTAHFTPPFPGHGFVELTLFVFQANAND